MWKYALLVTWGIALFCVGTADRLANYDLVTVPSTNAVEESSLKKVPGRIVNGTKATPGQFPQQVSLRRRYSQNHFCGGSILTRDWVITAGHCMIAYESYPDFIEAYTILVIAGEVVMKDKTRARQWSYVTERHVHPEFDIDTLQNDVALLKMEKPFVYDPFVQPAHVKLDPMTTIKPGTVCQVSGWGRKKYQGPISPYLLFVDVPLLPISLCRELLSNFSDVPPGMFCSGYIEGGRDACQGDSGGGLLCEGYLTGVVSGGEGCAWPRLPGLYTDVGYYLPWIVKYTVGGDRNSSVRSTSTPYTSTPYTSTPCTGATTALQSTNSFVILTAVFALMRFNL